MLHFEKWKIVLIAGICLLGAAFAAPNLLDSRKAENLPDWIPNQQVSLGLDLRGGSYLLLEADVPGLIVDRMEPVEDEVRRALVGLDFKFSGLVHNGERIQVVLEQGDPGELRRKLNEIEADRLEVEAGEGGALTIVFAEAYRNELVRKAMEQSVEIVRRRIDGSGVREPDIQRQGDNRILLQLPGVDNPERIKDLLKQTAKMDFRLVDNRVVSDDKKAPAGSEFLPNEDSNETTLLVRKRVYVSGEHLVDAQPSVDQNNQPVVSFKFDTIGAKRFGNVTKDNVGKRLAIVLDKKVISAPVIREPILGGSGQISGNFSVTEANDLALLLRGGALPTNLSIEEERTVGPGLGADSIAAGKIASIIGLVLVAGFMILAYGLFGVFVDIALLINLVLILGALSMLQATLTLPGIAGIVLTVGMAVDANVLIFERIREEMRVGRGVVSAIDSGYRRAIKTIVDANITTLIAGVFLFSLGSGPVKGFAVTLIIGILTSLFTATMVTRLMVIIWLRRRKRNETLPI